MFVLNVLIILLFQTAISKTITCTVKSSVNNQKTIFGNDSTIYIQSNCPQKNCDIDLRNLNGNSEFYLSGEFNKVSTPCQQVSIQKIILNDVQITDLIIGRVNITITEESQIHKIDAIHSVNDPFQSLWISSKSKKVFQISILQALSQHFKLVFRNIDLTITSLQILNDATIILLSKANVLVSDSAQLSDIALEMHSGSTMQFWLDAYFNNTMIYFEEEKSLKTSSHLYFTGLTTITFNILTPANCYSKYELFGGDVIYNKDIIKVSMKDEDVSKYIEDNLIIHYKCPIKDLYIYIFIGCCGLLSLFVGIVLIVIVMKVIIVPRLQKKLKNSHEFIETSSLLQKH